MRSIILIPLLASLFPALAQGPAEVDCPDTTLTSYLVSLIDTLFANGLTVFEQLIAATSETDSGYELLLSWYSDDPFTLLVPTDSAFQDAGIMPPFNLGEDNMTDLVALHTLKEKWGYDELPESPLHGIGVTGMEIRKHMNSSTESPAYQAMTLQRGDKGACSVRLVQGNGTTWSGAVDTSKTELTNIVILPVDTIIPFPPKLSSALTTPTTSRSKSGLPRFAKALDAAGGAQQLEALTTGGFTIFAPVDDAFTSDVDTLMSDTSQAVKVLGNHYTTNFSLYSGFWTNDKGYETTAVSGQTLKVTYDGTGSKVTLGAATAAILRSDIILENGVMHIIDKVLYDPSSEVAANGTGQEDPSTASKPTTSSSKDGTGASGNSSDTQEVPKGSGAGRTATLGKVGVLVLTVVLGFVGFF